MPVTPVIQHSAFAPSLTEPNQVSDPGSQEQKRPSDHSRPPASQQPTRIDLSNTGVPDGTDDAGLLQQYKWIHAFLRDEALAKRFLVADRSEGAR